jgi:hypothetical protein
MHFYNGLDLLDEERFRLTVFDDASELDGAGAPVVRRHFREWRKRALREEQGTREETEARRKKTHSPHSPYRAAEVDDEEASWNGTPDIRRPRSGHGYGLRIAAVRYRFCVAVDEAALQSVISSEGETRTGKAWMNLIEGNWTPQDAAALPNAKKQRSNI